MKTSLILILLIILSCVSEPEVPENFLKVNDKLYSGGSPEIDQFSYLRSKGIKSIICVDGALPNLAEAKAQLAKLK